MTDLTKKTVQPSLKQLPELKVMFAQWVNFRVSRASALISPKFAIGKFWLEFKATINYFLVSMTVPTGPMKALNAS